MKVSQLYGTNIECHENKKQGYILGISCVGAKIDGYICCNENEIEFFADSEGSVLRGQKMTAPKSGKESKNSYRLMLGRALYSENGKFLGHLEDFTVKANRITHAHVGKRKYEFARITLGDVAILKSDREIAATAAKDLFIDALCSE